MRVALVGHGKMGREVEAVLRERRHEAVVADRNAPFPAGCTVGIDFTRADAVPANVEKWGFKPVELEDIPSKLRENEVVIPF